MLTDRDAFIMENETPSHRLGQYNAWRLRQNPQAPFDLIWISIARAHAPAAHRVLPHGEPSIAIRRRRDKKNGDINEIALTVCGPLRHAHWYEPEPREELIALRLMPEVAASIFGVAPADYFDQPPAVTPAYLETACAQTLQLSEFAAPEAVAQQLACDLHRYAGGKDISETPEAIAAAILRQTNGDTRCAAIAKQLEISERTLRRRFRDHLGCSPKAYARQLRLTFAALAAEQKAKPQWADIAAQAGFHDQAHLINEFQALALVTPEQFHAERTALSAFSNTPAPQ